MTGPRHLPKADFGGHHCETAALRKLLAHHGHRVSEELLLGMGGGIGFMYLPGTPSGRAFVGGRNGPFPLFTRRMAAGVGLDLAVHRTTDPVAGYQRLRAALDQGTPVVCYADLYHLPYFRASRHFGGHAVVVRGIDEAADRVYLSDRHRTCRVVSRADLARARSSTHEPFPPRHAQLHADFAAATAPDPAAIVRAVRATGAGMLTAAGPTGLAALDQFGRSVTGLVRTGPPEAAVAALVDSFVDLELAGTGGNAFRSMYHRFLAEAAALAAAPGLAGAVPLAGALVTAWEELIGQLLPARLPALGALRRALRERDHALLTGDPPDEEHLAALAGTIAGQRRAAGSEVARHGEELAASLGAAVRAVVRRERALAEALQQVEVPR